jgi:hypothetical protein
LLDKTIISVNFDKFLFGFFIQICKTISISLVPRNCLLLLSMTREQAAEDCICFEFYRDCVGIYV